MKKAQLGFSMIEILVASLVVGLVLTAISSALIASTHNLAQARYEAAASKEAKKAMEVFVREKVLLGWTRFADAADTAATYCLNTLPLTSADFRVMSEGTCLTETYEVAGEAFRREVGVQVVSGDEIKVTVTVSWQDGARDREAVLEQNFTNY